MRVVHTLCCTIRAHCLQLLIQRFLSCRDHDTQAWAAAIVALAEQIHASSAQLLEWLRRSIAHLHHTLADHEAGDLCLMG